MDEVRFGRIIFEFIPVWKHHPEFVPYIFKVIHIHTLMGALLTIALR